MNARQINAHVELACFHWSEQIRKAPEGWAAMQASNARMMDHIEALEVEIGIKSIAHGLVTDRVNARGWNIDSIGGYEI